MYSREENTACPRSTTRDGYENDPEVDCLCIYECSLTIFYCPFFYIGKSKLDHFEMASDIAEQDLCMRQHDRSTGTAGGTLRIRDAILAAGSIHHIVSACAVFGSAHRWPSWGDDVSLQWVDRRSLESVLAEVDGMTEEFEFVCRHIGGIKSCQ